jgi:hypothetical protein
VIFFWFSSLGYRRSQDFFLIWGRVNSVSLLRFGGIVWWILDYAQINVGLGTNLSGIKQF